MRSPYRTLEGLRQYVERTLKTQSYVGSPQCHHLNLQL